MASRIILISALASLILLSYSCHSKVFTYHRVTGELNERFVIQYAKNKFDYYADSDSLYYQAHGNLEIHKDIIQFEFPEYAEEEILSPFRKGYFELTKLSESDSFEIDVKFFSVTYDWEMGVNRHFKPNFDILHLNDSSSIQKIPFPSLRYNSESDSILIKSDVPDHFSLFILVQEKGKYQLFLYLQSPLTVEFYESTATSCNLVTSKPTFTSKILSNRKDSIISFKSIDSPYGEYTLYLEKVINEEQ